MEIEISIVDTRMDRNYFLYYIVLEKIREIINWIRRIITSAKLLFGLS